MPEEHIPDPQTTSGRDLFISYASQDAAVANTLVETLERHGLRCWIAPRDVKAGAQYADAIVRALAGAKAFVLVLSEQAIASAHVGREIERAAAKKRPILAWRIDAAPLTPALEYFLGESQWIEAHSGKTEAAYARLIEAIRDPERSAPTDTATATSSAAHPSTRRKRMVLVAGLTIVASTLVLFFAPNDWRLKHAPAEPPSAAAAATTVALNDKSIAVLPFTDMSEKHDQEYFADGMAEELINTLTKVQGLKVPARTSTFAYKGRNTDIRQIAKDLGVSTILEGSVRAAGKRIRITAQLINAQDGLHLWSETYDREFTDLFKLQEDLAKAIVQALQVNLKGAALTSVIQAPPTQDVEAYQLYLRGWSLRARVSEQNENRAIDYFQQALARDPRFVRAYVGVGIVHVNLALLLGRRPFEHAAAAERAAREALALDPNIALAHAILSGVNDLRGNRLAGEAHNLAALALGSTDEPVHITSTGHQARGGHLRNALTEARRTIELAPADSLGIGVLASINSMTGREAEALKYAELAVELAYPKDSEPLASVYSDAALRAGRFAEAAEIAVKALDVSDPEQARTAEVIRLVHAALANPGQRASALAAQQRLYPPPVAGTPSPADLTNVGPCLESSYRYALLGANDAAYALANQCMDRMVPGAVYGGRSTVHLWHPWLRPFRQDPRFQALATRMGYMEYWQQYGQPDDCDLKSGKLTCH